VQAGLFFTIPLYLSVALGLSAIDTGVKIMPLSITLLITAAGIPRFFPNVSSRLVVKVGLLAMFAGIVSLFASIDVEAGAEIVTVPLLRRPHLRVDRGCRAGCVQPRPADEPEVRAAASRARFDRGVKGIVPSVPPFHHR
jgi:hypothetical protein